MLLIYQSIQFLDPPPRQTDYSLCSPNSAVWRPPSFPASTHGVHCISTGKSAAQKKRPQETNESTKPESAQRAFSRPRSRRGDSQGGSHGNHTSRPLHCSLLSLSTSSASDAEAHYGAAWHCDTGPRRRSTRATAALRQEKGIYNLGSGRCVQRDDQEANPTKETRVSLS